MAVWPVTARKIAAGEYSPAQYYRDVMAATLYRVTKELARPGGSWSEKEFALNDISQVAYTALGIQPVYEFYRVHMLPRYRFVMEGIVCACAAYRPPDMIYRGRGYTAVLEKVQTLCILGLRPALLSHVSERTVIEMATGRARRVMNDIYPGWVRNENVNRGWV